MTKRLKRKNRSLDDVRSDLESIREANSQQLDALAKQTVQRILKRIQRNQYKIIDSNTIRVTLWFCHYWGDDSFTLKTAGRYYGVEIKTKNYIGLGGLVQNFDVILTPEHKRI